MDNQNATTSALPKGRQRANHGVFNNEIIELKGYSPLLPLAIGLACSRVGLNASVYSNYMQTDAGFISDGTVLAAALAFLPLLIATTRIKGPLGKRFVNRSAAAMFALETLCVAFLEWSSLTGEASSAATFAGGALCTIASTCAMYYWLRRARCCGTVIAALLVFSAIVLSEIILLAISCLPSSAQAVVATCVSALQFPAQYMAMHQENPFQLAKQDKPLSTYSLKAAVRSKRLLASSALGVAALGLTVGLLRGYPNGQPIAFDSFSRVAYMAVTTIACFVIIAICLSGRPDFMATGIWVLLLLLACLSLTAFAAFPHALSVGAVFATSLNALAVGYCYYLTIEFMTSGWRDPYYYAFAGWIVYFLTRAFARIILSSASPLSSNTELTLAIMADAVVVSALLIFVRFLKDAKTPAQELPNPETSALQKVVALNSPEEVVAMTELRENSFTESIRELERCYLLSERETEVISLYAQGHTQKKIATELFITPGTVHEHIRHVYTKTGLHSRQEVLDYIHEHQSY